MYALGIQSFVIGHCKQRQQDIAAHLSGTRFSCNSEAIAATRDVDLQTPFNLSQVFIKLTAKIGKAAIISRFEDDVPRDPGNVQCRWPPVGNLFGL